MRIRKVSGTRSAMARVSRVVLGTACAGVLMSAAGQATAGTVTFDWFNVSSNGSTDASGELTLTSSLLNPPGNTPFTYLFDLTPAALAAAGETALGDVSSFTFSFAGQTLTKSDITSIASGWTDEGSGPLGNLLSSWSAANTFATGTLNLGNNSENSFAEFGSQSAVGFWLISPPSPVPLPDTGWLLLSGIGILGFFAKSRLHGTSAAD